MSPKQEARRSRSLVRTIMADSRDKIYKMSRLNLDGTTIGPIRAEEEETYSISI